MSFVAVAVSGAVGLGSAAINSGAAHDAASQQANAANQANQLQYQMFQQQQQASAPWRHAGEQALGQMNDPYFQKNFTMADFQADPGYAFRMQEAQKAMERSAAARGGLMGGGFAKALTDYSQGAASQEYQNAYNRFTNDQSNRFNRLASIAGIGQAANGQMAQAGQNYASNVGANTMGAANAAGAAGMASANAWGNAGAGIGGNIMGAAMMNRFAPQQQPQQYAPAQTMGGIAGSGYWGGGPVV